ncbi:MAG: PadR family transcriptional regulator [Rhodoluna sp.]|nr:PadR family transcriptional regulator [Rhodoluna sp.]
MSVKASILAVLTMGECHGYQLRQEIESRTGGSWQINIGQVYSTLERLERDGLVEAIESNEQGQTRYRVTEAGAAEASLWLTTAIASTAETRNELAMKLALAVTIPGCDVEKLVNAQRVQTMRTLQALTATKREVDQNDASELPWLLIADLNIFNCEAELRWLEHIEGTLARSLARGLDATQELSATAKRGRPAKTN